MFTRSELTTARFENRVLPDGLGFLIDLEPLCRFSPLAQTGKVPLFDPGSSSKSRPNPANSVISDRAVRCAGAGGTVLRNTKEVGVMGFEPRTLA